jgi:dimethylaniline monooxygenase (N-oxide forming)
MFGRPFWDLAKPLYKPWVPAAVRNRLVRFLVWVVQGDMGKLGFPPPGKKIHATSNANIVNHLHYRRVVVKQGITAIDGQRITFADGTSEAFDALIAATGYLIDLDFIGPELVAIKDNGLDLYMRIVPPDWRGLYFLGFFNSDTAANWISEAQIRWIREFEMGRAALPDHAAMRTEIDERRTVVAREFKGTPRHGIEVEHMPYFADLKRTIREAQQRAQSKVRDIGIGAKKPVPLLDAAE